MKQPNIPFLQANGILWLCAKYSAIQAVILPQLIQPLQSLFLELLGDCKDIKTASTDPSTRKRALDKTIGAVWHGLHKRFDGIEQALSPASLVPLSDAAFAHLKFAQATAHALIGPSLSFLALPYKDQWVESDKRLARLDLPLSADYPQTLREALTHFGLGFELEQLEALHALYGQSIGATLAHSNSLDDLVAAWNSDLNHFFNGLYFHHNPDQHPAALPLIDALLAPIQEAKKQP
jgi:hypothetical protein